ncbi:MAG: hypothetical protein CSA68_11190 [Rhodobacterales bacterium]|nr:MAG: hypothetical protein CSA68_11190 [Rhodobacterales bacterium]
MARFDTHPIDLSDLPNVKRWYLELAGRAFSVAMHSRKMSGGCQCGDIRYEINPKAAKMIVCHCTSCQKQSASAFGLVYIIPGKDVTLLRGMLKKWVRTTDSGHLHVPDMRDADLARRPRKGRHDQAARRHPGRAG